MDAKDIQPPASLVTLTFRVDKDLADAFKELADGEDRPVAAKLRRMVRTEVDRAANGAKRRVA